MSFKLPSVTTFAGEVLHDFKKASLWQRGLVIASLVLSGLVVALAIFAVTGGPGGSISNSSARTNPTRVPEHAVAGATAPALATQAATSAPVLDCDSMRGRASLSEEERAWFVANCVAPSVDPTGAAPIDGGVVEPPAPPPTSPLPPIDTPTSPPPDAFGGSDAIALAVSYFAGSPEGSYTVQPSACNATQLSGSAWSVSCVGVVTGCTRPECRVVVNACVTEATRAVSSGLC